MSYRDYIANILTWATVTDELDYARHEDEHVVIIKELTGSIYRDATIKPIQIEVHTDNVVDTKALLETFAKAYNNTDYTEDLDYIKQYYSTPMVINNFNMSGTNYSSTILVSGTLVISGNVSDIKTVLIDGELYETTHRIIIYTTIPDSQPVSMDGDVNATQIRGAVLRISFNLVSRADTLTQKIRNIRRGGLPINTSFTVKLVHTDNEDYESYTMKLSSNTLNSDNTSLPIMAVEFIK